MNESSGFISPSDASSPILSVLMVGFNSLHHLPDCLDSLVRHISVAFEVIVVDNGSTDNTVAYLSEHYPWVKLIPGTINRGFSGGNNEAARHARGRYLLLLNCDTVLLTDVAAGIRILEKMPKVGIVGARMYDADGRLNASTGHFPAPWRLWKFTLQWSDPLSEPIGAPELAAYRSDWVQGSFLMTTRENWVAVDGFDESGFMYAEDVEFCGHTRQRGLLSVQCSHLMYTHFGGYDHERMKYLYAGYRRFHASYSDRKTQRSADAVLIAGLIPRIAVFWILARLSRNEEWKLKSAKFIEVLREWKELAPKPSTRRPIAKGSGDIE